MTKSTVTKLRSSLNAALIYGLMAAMLSLGHPPKAFPQSGPGGSLMDRRLDFNIAAQTSLEDALIEWGSKSGIAVMMNTRNVAYKVTVGINGALSAREALSRLLEGSGLSYKESGGRVIVIPIGEFSHVSMMKVDPDLSTSVTASESSDTITGTQEGPKLEEVLVTAQKRSENVLEVPAAVSVVSTERLAQLQVNSLVDLDSYVPGLSIEGQGAPGARTIVLRGLNAGSGIANAGPTVATYIDELPFGAASPVARSSLYGADLQRYDVAQVEILKGPQGTLYGASTLAGLIKYRLVQPDLERLDIVAGTDTEYIDGSDKPGWGLHGAVSLPIVTDTLAVRLSGFKKETSGYIDNVGLDLKDENGTAESGGVGSVLWKPTESLTVKGTVLAQDVNAANQASVNVDGNTLEPVFGPLKVDTNFREPIWNQARNSALTVDWDLGFATLTSATGYSSFVTQVTYDMSVFGIYCVPDPAEQIPGCPAYPHADALSQYIQPDRVYKFTHETRLTSPENQRIQWMVGVFYSRERANEYEYWPTYTPSYQKLPSPQNDIDDYWVNWLFSERAGFANVTFKISDQWDITGGERYSNYRQSDFRNGTAGDLSGCLTASTVCPTTLGPLGSDGVSVWMGNMRYHVSKDSLLYLRASTGFQPAYFYVPASSYESGRVLPAKTINYEVGFKGQFFDKRLQLDLAAFDIDWTNMQVTAIDPEYGFGYPANAGSARSSGVEFATIYQLMRGLQINTTLAYTNARLTRDQFSSPGVYSGKKGDQLPEAPLWSGSISLDYEGALTSKVSWLSGVTYRYRDKVVNQFAGSGMPYPMGPLNTMNLYAGIEVQQFTVKLYSTNVSNDRGYSGQIYSPNPALNRYVPIQPRTVGLEVEYHY